MSEIMTERVELKVDDGTTMGGFVARPREGRHPGLALFQEAFGVNAHLRDVAQRFAREGFVVLAPELFHRTAPPGFEAKYDFAEVKQHYEASTKPEPLALDLKASYAWLSAHPAVRPEAISCAGFCMGGRAAYLADAVAPFASAVSFYGGGIAPALLDRAPSLSGPLLMFWGGLDAHIPPEQIAALTGALRAAGKPFINVEFSASNHAFFNDARPNFDPDAARQAWALTLAFLKK